jgi:DNA-binding transcriptional LysR family regulator
VPVRPVVRDRRAVPGIADLRDVSLRELMTLRTLAQQASFGKAATRLGVSQPAVTRTLLKLECLLGVRLFTRTTRHVTITPAGEEFLASVERALVELHGTCVRLRRYSLYQIPDEHFRKSSGAP